MENEEFVREFLEESEENLDRLDQDFVALEKEPRDHDRLANIYRTIHTIKGTSGFFGFAKLGAIAHAGENLLSRLRDGELLLDEEITSALLESVDAIREVLANIDKAGEEGDGNYRELNSKLARLRDKEQDRSQIATEASRPEEAAPAVEASSADEAEAVTVDEAEAAEPPTTESLAEEQAPPQPHTSPTPTDEAPIGTTTSAETEASTRDAAAPTESRKEPLGADTAAAVSEGSIRVDVGLLNQLVDLVGELVLARNQLIQFATTEQDRRFVSVAQRMNRITTELQERVMKTRMQPIGNIWGKFPRVVRDLAVACGKEVELEMDGRETEVDKSLLEAIKDPLTHLIRNSVDHGIEAPDMRVGRGKSRSGHLFLRAWHEGGQVNIEITDDGGGIDPDKVKQKASENELITAVQASSMSDQQLTQLIFRPGFSTAEQVTDVSGRGVGMDVVKTNIESIGGTIDIQSRVGLGTTIKVKIPLTLAIVPALMISSGQDRFAIPQVHLVEMLRLDGSHAEDAVEMIRSTPVYRLRGKLLPLVYLNDVFGCEKAEEGDREPCLKIVVLQADTCRFGLVVDSVERTEEIVVKPLHRALSVIPQLAGATVMGDGRVALILDVIGLANCAGLELEEIERHTAEQVATSERSSEHRSLLVCELRSGRRLAVPLTEVDRLEDFPKSAIERADDREVVQYREQIMPLVSLSSAIRDTPGREPPSASTPDATTGVKAVIISRHGQSAGIVVERILDVVQTARQIRPSTSGSGIGGSTVIDGHVTDIVDVHRVIQAAGVASAEGVPE